MRLRPKTRRTLLIVFCSGIALLLGLVLLLHFEWPFRASEIQSRLSSATSTRVSFSGFHEKYFPPGCVLDQVSFQRSGSPEPLATVRRLTITSSLGGMLRHRVSLMRAEGMQISLTRSDFSQWNSGGKADPPSDASNDAVTVGRLVADGAVVEVGGTQPLRFTFDRFTAKDINKSGPISVSALLENPLPKGILRIAGKIGPFNSSHTENTAMSGEYSLENADLSVFGFIAGRISSRGTFKGDVQAMQISGTTNTPEFEVTDTHHALPLKTDFSAVVDAASGDVQLPRVQAQFGKDEIEAQGNIARKNGKRMAVLDLTCDRGRIEDTFYPFIHNPKSPLTGNVEFRMHVTIPPGKQPFLKKVDLQTHFDIADAHFSHASTQKDIDKIATNKPVKSDPPPSTLRGAVTIKNGVARFQDLSVKDEGAAAQLHGRYDLLDERVDLHGHLKTSVSLSRTTHGLKAVFAKIIEPFFKKKPHDTVVPVKIGGTYDHPTFGLDIGSS
jgi:hypothetical protein